MRVISLVFLGTMVLSLNVAAVAQGKILAVPVVHQRTCPFIVSPSRPSDSRGETVYEIQGDNQLNIPAVPGACTSPVIVSSPKVKFPKELKDDKQSATVEVIAVVTAQGDVIDAKASDAADPRAAKVAVGAVMQFKFMPATLDGKPVAIAVKMPFNFILKKFWGGHYPGDTPSSATP